MRRFRWRWLPGALLAWLLIGAVSSPLRAQPVQLVSFEGSAGDLVNGDTNGLSDVFVRDLVSGTTRLVSVSTNGGAADGASRNAVMTPDGRCVAFVSAAANLVPAVPACL